jgi:hypothetical protein
MGNSKSKILPLNNECPICYDINSNMLVLECGHSFDYICLQKTYIDFLLNNTICLCPLCRCQLSIKEIKKIFKIMYINNIYPTEWKNRNTLNLKNNIVFNNLSKITVKPNIYLYIPLYNVNKINIPCFFHLDNIIDIKEIQNDISNIFSSKIECIINNNNWEDFIKKNKLEKYLLYSSNNISTNKKIITLYIRNKNKFMTFNQYDGTMERRLNIYSRPATILFRLYFVFNKKLNQLLFINEMYGILFN